MDSYKGHNFEVAVSNVWLVLFAALFWMSFIYSFLIFILCNAAPKYQAFFPFYFFEGLRGGTFCYIQTIMNIEHTTYTTVYIYIYFFKTHICIFLTKIRGSL